MLLGCKRLCRLSYFRSDYLGNFSFTSPHQHTIVLIDRQALGMDDLFLQILDVCIVHAKLSLQGAIGDASLPLQKCENLSEHLIKIHYRCSTSARAASPWGNQY